jgi:hypothetical protein
MSKTQERQLYVNGMTERIHDSQKCTGKWNVEITEEEAQRLLDEEEHMVCNLCMGGEL